MKKITTTLVMVIMTMAISFGQTQDAITTNGVKVILNTDGTWKYAENRKDSTNLNSFDCSKWISTETDKVDGSTSTYGRNDLLVSTDNGENGFGIILVQAAKGEVIVSIHAVGASRCIDEGSKINILFTDGTRLALNNKAKFNCKGNATLYFGGVFGKKSELEELKTKKIQIMRVWTNDSYVEKDFTVDNQNEFYNVINCLMK